MSKEKKVVWITGASSGIGEALVKEYASKGYCVILSARRQEELERVQKKIDSECSRVLPLDLVQIDSFDEKCAIAIGYFGHIDVLINNGGISQRSLVRESDLAIDRKVMEVNYFGNIALTKALLPHFLERKTGHVVVLSSLTGKFGFFLRSAYAASKHALHGFYESLRLEEQKNGLRVTLVCPTLIRTDISVNALNSKGERTKEMDKNQKNGISPEACAKEIFKAQQKGKLEAVVGKQKKAVWIKRFFPKLFHRMIAKRSAR